MVLTLIGDFLQLLELYKLNRSGGATIGTLRL
jgi:hypothetical protein